MVVGISEELKKINIISILYICKEVFDITCVL